MIPILNLTRQYASLKDKIDKALIDVAESGHYILGPEVQKFEKEMAAYLGVKHVIGCANGTDALFLALAALKIGDDPSRGDEVITTSFSFIATSESIVRAGAKPVFADIDPDTFNFDIEQLESLITPKTRAILPVHIFGQPVNMDAVQALAKKHNLAIVEDCAQSIGARYQGKQTGTIGDIGCFSFFPSKNLGAFGDGGMMTTNDDNLADRLKMLRSHGSRERYYHEESGINSRLDEMQAAILRIKLPYIEEWNQRRRDVAETYNELLKPLAARVQTPVVADDVIPVFHQYTLRLLDCDSAARTKVQDLMKDAGVQTMIYYPVPLHRQTTHQDLGCRPEDFPVCETVSEQVLSLPMFPEITREEQETVAAVLVKALEQIRVPVRA